MERTSDATLGGEPSLVDALVGRIACRARRRRAWLEHLREGSDGPAAVRTKNMSGFSCELDDPATEQAWYRNNPALDALNAAIERYEAALAAERRSPLARLTRVFGLSAGERDLLDVCLALELEPGLSVAYGELQNGRAYATDSLAARLCGHGRTLLLDPAGALRRWDLVQVEDATPGEPAPLRPDPHVVGLALDRDSLDPELIGIATLIEPKAPLASWPVAELTERIARALEQGAALRLILTGSRGSGRRTLAACLCTALGASALALDAGRIAESDFSQLCLRAHRQAVLSGLALVWCGELAGRTPPALPGVAPLQFVIAEPDIVLPPQPGVIDERFEMPRLDLEQRRTLWRRLVPACRAWTDADRDHVIERYRVSAGDLAEIGMRGVSEAREAASLCRSLTRTHLGELGRLVECPFSWDDLVLPEKTRAALDDFLFEARERVRFWEDAAARRLFPRGTGLVALMTGPPGTGKTMAAQVIAAELELDLFRIDLATCVSKYIGETAKNLRRIFLRAAEMNAVVLFDEADALFTKRTDVKDAHDRYANTDTNYLLQLIEDYEGVALLATNKRQNIDTAFVRRIRYLFEFQRPAATERRAIWRKLVRELLGAESERRLGNTLDVIADTVELSGAQIKLSLLGGMFAAHRAGQALALEHLYHGMSRELAKEGRGLSPNERERIDRHG